MTDERRPVSEIARIIAGEPREQRISHGRIIGAMVDRLMDELPHGTIGEYTARARELARDPLYTLGGEPLRPLPRGGVRVVLEGWRFDKLSGSHSIRMAYARDGRADDATCSASPCTWAPRCPHCRACSLSWCRCTCARFSP